MEPSNIHELDMLVFAMTIAVCCHATRDKLNRNGGLQLIAAGLLLGVFTEHASIRLGGTHCHASGIIDVSECSSLNSVAYYVPWLYSCVVGARRLCGSGPASKHLVPIIGGTFFPSTTPPDSITLPWPSSPPKNYRHRRCFDSFI